MEHKVHKEVTDLGAGAYLLMHGFNVIGRRGKAIVFGVPKDDVDDFDQKTMEYLSSEFHRFDACLMSLKKIGEYMPNKD